MALFKKIPPDSQPWTRMFAKAHVLSDEDKQFIAESEYPLWRSITPQEIRSFRTTPVPKWIIFFGIPFLIAMIVFFDHLSDIDDIPPLSFERIGMTVVLLVAIVFIIVLAVVNAYWSDLDESAIIAEIPVAYCACKTYHLSMRYTPFFYKSFYEMFKHPFRPNHEVEAMRLAFYLPDGKYIVELEGFRRIDDYPNPKSIKIVNYKGRYKWQPAIDMEAYIKKVHENIEK